MFSTRRSRRRSLFCVRIEDRDKRKPSINKTTAKAHGPAAGRRCDQAAAACRFRVMCRKTQTRGTAEAKPNYSNPRIAAKTATVQRKRMPQHHRISELHLASIYIRFKLPRREAPFETKEPLPEHVRILTEIPFNGRVVLSKIRISNE